MGKRKNRSIFYCIMLTLFCQVFIGVGNVNAGVNDFYFSDFTGDYYLSKDAEGISHLRVKESVTVQFPDYEQNKGICRQIPYTNQAGKNTTLSHLTRSDLKLTRNGNPEPIYSIDKENDYYSVCTGTEEYVLGEQTYVFEYEFERVVTEYDYYRDAALLDTYDELKDYYEEVSERGAQELYWDTNGNGAWQRFDKVTARLHFEDEDVWTGASWCYVGRYGDDNQDRCEISAISDGVEFVAEDLVAYENLTFDVELKPGSFVVPEPEKDYILVWIAAIVGGICLAVIARAGWKYFSSRDKAKYYKSIFVKPEYQPNDKYTLPEMTEIYLGKKKDMRVGMLLEMVVKRKIAFQKTDKKKWNIIVKDLDGVRSEYTDLLAILNGGSKPEVGDTIGLKRRTATSKLISRKNDMERKIKNDLHNAGLTENGYEVGGSKKQGIGGVIVTSVIVVPVVVMIFVMVLSMLEGFVDLDPYGRVLALDYDDFFSITMLMIAVTVPIVVALSNGSKKYAKHTLKGLEASRYMDGLKLYIGMAEADRMKMLQSVEGADITAEGIVKLYEKLLPYAAIFGLEKSWMNEMREYCELQEITEPDYLLAGITASELSRGLNTASSYVSSATTIASTMSSSGGGSSSGFSGGGGGGFSGGGGGGGGFSGR